MALKSKKSAAANTTVPHTISDVEMDLLLSKVEGKGLDKAAFEEWFMASTYVSDKLAWTSADMANLITEFKEAVKKAASEAPKPVEPEPVTTEPEAVEEPAEEPETALPGIPEAPAESIAEPEPEIQAEPIPEPEVITEPQAEGKPVDQPKVRSEKDADPSIYRRVSFAEQLVGRASLAVESKKPQGPVKGWLKKVVKEEKNLLVETDVNGAQGEIVVPMKALILAVNARVLAYQARNGGGNYQELDRELDRAWMALKRIGMGPVYSWERNIHATREDICKSFLKLVEEFKNDWTRYSVHEVDRFLNAISRDTKLSENTGVAVLKATAACVSVLGGKEFVRQVRDYINSLDWNTQAELPTEAPKDVHGADTFLSLINLVLQGDEYLAKKAKHDETIKAHKATFDLFVDAAITAHGIEEREACRKAVEGKCPVTDTSDPIKGAVSSWKQTQAWLAQQKEEQAKNAEAWKKAAHNELRVWMYQIVKEAREELVRKTLPSVSDEIRLPFGKSFFTLEGKIPASTKTFQEGLEILVGKAAMIENEDSIHKAKVEVKELFLAPLVAAWNEAKRLFAEPLAKAQRFTIMFLRYSAIKAHPAAASQKAFLLERLAVTHEAHTKAALEAFFDVAKFDSLVNSTHSLFEAYSTGFKQSESGAIHNKSATSLILKFQAAAPKGETKSAATTGSDLNTNGAESAPESIMAKKSAAKSAKSATNNAAASTIEKEPIMNADATTTTETEPTVDAPVAADASTTKTEPTTTAASEEAKETTVTENAETPVADAPTTEAKAEDKKESLGFFPWTTVTYKKVIGWINNLRDSFAPAKDGEFAKLVGEQVKETAKDVSADSKDALKLKKEFASAKKDAMKLFGKARAEHKLIVKLEKALSESKAKDDSKAKDAKKIGARKEDLAKLQAEAVKAQEKVTELSKKVDAQEFGALLPSSKTGIMLADASAKYTGAESAPISKEAAIRISLLHANTIHNLGHEISVHEEDMDEELVMVLRAKIRQGATEAEKKAFEKDGDKIDAKVEKLMNRLPSNRMEALKFIKKNMKLAIAASKKEIKDLTAEEFFVGMVSLEIVDQVVEMSSETVSSFRKATLVVTSSSQKAYEEALAAEKKDPKAAKTSAKYLQPLGKTERDGLEKMVKSAVLTDNETAFLRVTLLGVLAHGLSMKAVPESGVNPFIGAGVRGVLAVVHGLVSTLYWSTMPVRSAYYGAKALVLIVRSWASKEKKEELKAAAIAAKDAAIEAAKQIVLIPLNALVDALTPKEGAVSVKDRILAKCETKAEDKWYTKAAKAVGRAFANYVVAPVAYVARKVGGWLLSGAKWLVSKLCGDSKPAANDDAVAAPVAATVGAAA